MKRITVILAVAILTVSAYGQGFLNLNFESAQNLPGNPGNGVYASAINAFPNWTLGGGEFAVFYESNFLGDAGASAVQLEGGSLAFGGSFSAGLNDGGSISQTALVPANAESLEFDAYLPGGSGFELTLGGDELSYSAISQGPDYIEYGANIPAGMEGQMDQLTFFCDPSGGGGALLDNIQFSSLPTPEPGELALIGLGAGLFYMRKRVSGPNFRAF